jgi:glycosyltransferase involved in cell wall biosynthesis
MMRVCLDHGHSVNLLCKGKTGLPADETLNGVRIHRVGAAAARPSRVQRILAYPLFFNPIWTGASRRFFLQEHVDLIVVRDLPLALLAARTGEFLGVPVVLDMAENYPAALKAYQNPLYAPFLLGNAWLPKKYEQICLRRVTHTFVVAQEQSDRLVEAGVDSGRITLVGNTPEDAFRRSARPLDSALESQGEQPPVLLFVGMLDAHRGIHLVIRAMPDLLKEFAGLTLVLVGNGTRRDELMALANSLGVADAVRFPGWVDLKNVPEYIRASSICLIPHLRSEHTDTTLPNKLFDYMAFGKPVVASDCRPLRRVIEETGCGRTFRSGDVEDLKRILRTMLRGVDRESMGRNGLRAVEEKYNWNVDERVFLAALDRLAPPRRAS